MRVKRNAIIVLAAGGSSRMESDTPKIFLKLNHISILDMTLSKAIDMNPDYIICVYRDSHKTEFKNKIIHYAQNKNWETGISSSISTAIKYINNNCTEIDYVIILLGDQPLIRLNDLKKMENQFTKYNNKIIVTDYDNAIGVPAIFPSNLFDELKNLNGDIGAKQIFNKHIESLVKYKHSQPIFDIDNLEDLNRANQINKHIND